MSRSGYNYDIDNWNLIKYRGHVASAIRGKRGQRLLRDLVLALDAMTEKRLIPNMLENERDVCALGAVGRRRETPMEALDPEDYEQVAGVFDIAEQLAREVVFVNDEEGPCNETPEERWARVRAWAVEHLREPPEPDGRTRPTGS